MKFKFLLPVYECKPFSSRPGFFTSSLNSLVVFTINVFSSSFAFDSDFTVLSSSDDVKPSWFEMFFVSGLFDGFVAFFFFLTKRGLAGREGSFNFTIGGALDGLVGVLERVPFGILYSKELRKDRYSE